MLPTILEHGERDIVLDDLEGRIPGVDLALALSRMEGVVRRRALLAYTNTAAFVRTINYAQNEFGEVLAANPIRRESGRFRHVTRTGAPDSRIFAAKG